MQIASLAVRFPSLRVSNEDLLGGIAEHSTGQTPQQIRSYQRRLQIMMRRAGSGTRYYRDRSNNETAMPLIIEATREAISQSGVPASDIGLLIYCGVGRGFLEPAMAYFVCDAVGLACECFDVLDACMSWVRALSIAYSFLRQRTHDHVVIVNGEFNIYESGYPALLKADDPGKWRYTFPAFTIGEAATATVVSHSSAAWNFHFRSNPSLVSLCTLPLASYRDFATEAGGLAPNGANHFMSLGTELSRTAVEEMTQFVRATYSDPMQFDLWFPHAASNEACGLSSKQLALGDKLYSRTFGLYGNLVSASIPVAIAEALTEKRLTRGMKVVLCPASAGMSFALADFVY